MSSLRPTTACNSAWPLPNRSPSPISATRRAQATERAQGSDGGRGLAPITERGGLEALKRMSIAPGQLSPSGFHPMGTCRMGHDPASSVVGPWGEAYGVRGLYIADASIFPSCPGVNPQITIMAFATRTAFHILT
jgi:choline dehydrogenase-like flavoprotein